MSPHSSSTAVPDVRSPRPGAVQQGPGYFVAGTGTPVVMLHSSLGSKSQWTTLAERLASRFRVIALDLCGYGDNPGRAAGTSFTVDEEVRLVTAHLDRLVEPHVRVHVVGHSYGGLVALRFAQCRRGRVASLTLYEPVAFGLLDDDDSELTDARLVADRVLRLVTAGRRHEAAQAFVDFWSGEGTYAALSPTAKAGVARRIDKVPLDFRAAWGWRLAPSDLRAIVTPTLLLAGIRSPTVAQRIVIRLSRTLPHRRIGWFDSGHMGPITDGVRVNPWIEAFVDLCAARDAAPAALHAASKPAPWLTPVR